MYRLTFRSYRNEKLHRKEVLHSVARTPAHASRVFFQFTSFTKTRAMIRHSGQIGPPTCRWLRDILWSGIEKTVLTLQTHYLNSHFCQVRMGQELSQSVPSVTLSLFAGKTAHYPLENGPHYPLGSPHYPTAGLFWPILGRAPFVPVAHFWPTFSMSTFCCNFRKSRCCPSPPIFLLSLI